MITPRIYNLFLLPQPDDASRHYFAPLPFHHPNPKAPTSPPQHSFLASRCLPRLSPTQGWIQDGLDVGGELHSLNPHQLSNQIKPQISFIFYHRLQRTQMRNNITNGTINIFGRNIQPIIYFQYSARSCCDIAGDNSIAPSTLETERSRGKTGQYYTQP